MRYDKKLMLPYKLCSLIQLNNQSNRKVKHSD